MTQTRYRNRFALPISLLVFTLLLSSACGTLEIGIEVTPTPGDVAAATATEVAAPATDSTEVPPTPMPTPTPIPPATELRVAFVNVTEHGNNAWLWTEETGEAVPLTKDGGVIDVKISDDGELVAFTRGDGLWMVRSDGAGERQLVSAEDFAAMEAKDPELEVVLNRFEWVPGTHVLAFNTRLRTEIGLVLNDDLHLVDASTLDRTALLPPGEGGEFTYSPDGRQIAIVTPGKISLVDADGENRREALTYAPIATASEFQYYPRPVWAADSSSLRVAIPPVDPYAEPPQLTSIWRMHTDGTPASLLTSITAAQVSWPAFSPDLRYIAHLYAERVDPASSAYPESDLLLTDLKFDRTDTTYPTEDDITQVTLESGETITHRPMAGEIYGWAPDAQHLAFAAQPDPQLPFQAQIVQLGGDVVPAYSDTDGAVIDVRWVDADHYLFLAQSPKGWDILLGEMGGSVTGVAGVVGSRPAYDFAAPVVSAPVPTPVSPTPTPVTTDSGDSHVPFGLIYQSAGGLWHVNADGESARILELGEASPHTWPAVSPDGAQILYAGGDDIWLADVATGERRNLTQTLDRSECCAQWALGQPDVILFNSWPLGEVGMDFGHPTLARLDGPDAEQASDYLVLDDGELSYTLPAVSPDARAVAYDRASQPWVYRQDTGPEPFDLAPYGLSNDPELHFYSPAWSPDDRRLVWLIGDCREDGCQRSIGMFDLEAQTARFVHPHRPAGMGGQPPAPIWSPDGQWLAFAAWAEEPGESGMWVLRVDGQQEDEHHLATGRGRGSPDVVWSPDGGWLAIGDSAQGEEPKRFWLAEVGTWGLQRLDLPADAYLLAWVNPRP